MFALVKIIDNVLYAIQDTQSSAETQDVFTALFERWQDPEYLEAFFHQHQKDLQSGFFGDIGIEEAIFITLEQSYEFQQKILDIAQKKDQKHQNLQEFFRPLYNYEKQRYPIPQLQESKAYGGKRSWLRLYAIRIEPHVYIITGGAIKLTRSLQERDHTNRELKKIHQVKAFLTEEGIMDNESITGYLEL